MDSGVTWHEVTGLTGQLFYSRDAGDSWQLMMDNLPPILSVETAMLA